MCSTSIVLQPRDHRKVGRSNASGWTIARIAALLLVLAVSLLVFLAPANIASAACLSRPPPPCNPAAFTGSVRPQPDRCVHTTPPPCSRREGPRGLRGVAGKPGAVGRTGRAGVGGFTGPLGPHGAGGPAGATGATGEVGSAGAAGAQGVPGGQGFSGALGPQGPGGPAGATGATGEVGSAGAAGAQGAPGVPGVPGTPGSTGATGPQGPAGATGSAGPSENAEFFALMPPDNAATVAGGSAVEFPQNGPNTGAITRKSTESSRTFILPNIGTYCVAFSVSVDEAGQLELKLGSLALPYTVYGRATGTSQITGEALVTTTERDSVVSVINPAGNSTALTITPVAGGAHPAVASLVIEQLS
jgi:hypothetical protein